MMKATRQPGRLRRTAELRSRRYNTHTSDVVMSVVNHSRCPVWFRSAYGTKGERRRCPAGLPLGDCSACSLPPYYTNTDHHHL